MTPKMLNLIKKYFPEKLGISDVANNDYALLSVDQKKKLIENYTFIKLNGALRFEKDALYKTLINLMEDTDHDVQEHLAKHIVNIPIDIDKLNELLNTNEVLIQSIIANNNCVSDNELCNICRANPSLISSLAKRRNISELLADFIVAYGSPYDIMAMLPSNYRHLSNNTIIEILTKCFDFDEAYKLVTKHIYNDDISLNAVIKKLPSYSKQKFVNHLTHINDDVIIYYNLGQKAFSFEFNLSYSYEKSLSSSLDASLNSSDMKDIVMLRYICSGDFYSFVYAISHKAKMPFDKVKHIITHKFSFNEFDEILLSLRFSADIISAIKAVCNLLYESSLEEYIDSKNFKYVMNKRFGTIKHRFTQNNTIHYVMSLINSHD
jgi:hypothetical protein